MKCKVVTFEEVYRMIRKVANDVKASAYRATTVVGLARGGWIPARIMCDFLGITDLVSLKVEHWLQTGKTKDEATIKYPLNTDFSGKRVLVVDDITDTGKSLITSTNYLRRLNPNKMKVATMQYIPMSQFKPDYFAEKVKVWTWFIYPWNWIEDTSTLIVRLMNTQKDNEWRFRAIDMGLNELFEIKWNQAMLRDILNIMVERDQIIKELREADVVYKLKKDKVIQL